jgi:hypothetical protein
MEIPLEQAIIRQIKRVENTIDSLELDLADLRELLNK